MKKRKSWLPIFPANTISLFNREIEELFITKNQDALWIEAGEYLVKEMYLDDGNSIFGYFKYPKMEFWAYKSPQMIRIQSMSDIQHGTLQREFSYINLPVSLAGVEINNENIASILTFLWSPQDFRIWVNEEEQNTQKLEWKQIDVILDGFLTNLNKKLLGRVISYSNLRTYKEYSFKYEGKLPGFGLWLCDINIV